MAYKKFNFLNVSIVYAINALILNFNRILPVKLNAAVLNIIVNNKSQIKFHLKIFQKFYIKIIK